MPTFNKEVTIKADLSLASVDEVEIDEDVEIGECGVYDIHMQSSACPDFYSHKKALCDALFNASRCAISLEVE
jgi:hypothetical protein